MSIIDALIYDRTQQDLMNETDKAFISYKDLNRIEEAVSFLSNALNNYGYFNTTQNKTNWDISDIRKNQDCQRIKTNYEVLKSAFFYNFNTPDFEWASIEEANKIEKILKDTSVLIDNMAAAFKHSGTFNLGESEGLI